MKRIDGRRLAPPSERGARERAANIRKDETDNRDEQRADGVCVLRRVERDAAEQARCVVAEFVRHPSVRALVRRDGEQEHHHVNDQRADVEVLHANTPLAALVREDCQSSMRFSAVSKTAIAATSREYRAAVCKPSRW